MKYDIIVLGVDRADMLVLLEHRIGFKVAVIKKESLGGVCLNWVAQQKHY
jgi:dihydrolipoamide dehydrogenase